MKCVEKTSLSLRNSKVCDPLMVATKSTSKILVSYRMGGVGVVPQCLKFGKFINAHGPIDKELQTIILCTRP